MHNRKIAVIGLGYVGLPVAVHLGIKNKVLGFDINSKRVDELKKGKDSTLEVEEDLLQKTNVLYTCHLEEIKSADFFIVTVPTPVDDAKTPDLTPMIKASESVGKVLKKGDIVVYESTVYPGVCEDICMPILEKLSGLKGGVDFKIGYSPERINPGDKEHTFTKIKKVVSAQDKESLDIVANVYSSVVEAGIFKASSIKVAEAAKVIENTQRDINIALMNELALIFDKMGIDTQEVLEAASTKWNFLKFYPGLVGGHCIGVDPYYLTHKATLLGYHPQVILAGRKINDEVAKFIAEKTVKLMINQGHKIKNAKIAILGLTFKENCPDLRNSKVFDIITELSDFGVDVKIYDPWVNIDELDEKYKKIFTQFDKMEKLEGIILAVSHKNFKELSPKDYMNKINPGGVFIDIKGVYNKDLFGFFDGSYWRL